MFGSLKKKKKNFYNRTNSLFCTLTFAVLKKTTYQLSCTCNSQKFPQLFAIKITTTKIVIIFNVNHRKRLSKRRKVFYQKKAVNYVKREERKAMRSNNFCG